MLNKITEHRSFGVVTEGTERWASNTSIYTFNVQETETKTEEGDIEKTFLMYEFSNLLSWPQIRTDFVRAYAEYKGYNGDMRVQLLAGDNEVERAQLKYILAEGEYLASGMGQMNRLPSFRRLKQAEISVHDVSPAVNEFTLMGKQIWLPNKTRVSLSNSINIEKAAGKEVTTLWFGGVRYEIPIGQALQMLAALEIYALECYNVTHKHLAEVDKLTSVETIKTYSYKTGYPDKLNFDSREIRVC